MRRNLLCRGSEKSSGSTSNTNRRSTSNESDKIKEDTLRISKEDLIPFTVDVMNCTAQTDHNTDKIKITVRATDTYPGVKGLGRETVESVLDGETLIYRHEMETVVAH